jgi:multicomponent Na+:H+ antiporter subunit F
VTAVTTVCLAVLVVAGLLCLVRLARPGSLADRIVALDTLLVVTVTGIAVAAVRSGSGAFLDALLVTSLLGFVGTTTVARFMERRGP